jgi:hypothetical protein
MNDAPRRVSIIPVAALLVVGDIQLPDIGMRAEAVGFSLNERRRNQLIHGVRSILSSAFL